MTNEIVVHQVAFTDMERMASAIAKSGLFGLRTPEQALALMAISQAEGRHPALAARDFDIIQGRPAKKSEAMARDFLSAGGKVEWHVLTDDKADATFSHPGGGKVRISWDMDRAAKAGLAGKDMWKKFPRQMLRSRVVSEGVRTVWPMATSGLYVPEEVGDFSGATIDAEPEPTAPPEPPKPEPQPKKMSWTQHADALELAERDAGDDPLQIAKIITRSEITELRYLAEQGAITPAKTRILDCIARMERKYLADPPQPEEPEDDAPAIVGQDKVFAG